MMETIQSDGDRMVGRLKMECRQVEIVVRDGPPHFALVVVDMATGRRIGALKALDFKLDAENRTARASLSYLKLEGSPDGTVAPDHPDRVVVAVGEDGETEVVKEDIEIVRFATSRPPAERPKRPKPESATTQG